MCQNLIAMADNIEVPGDLQVVSFCGDEPFREEEGVLPVVAQCNSREKDEHVPLNCLLPDQSSVSDWVLDKVKEVQHFGGVECKG